MDAEMSDYDILFKDRVLGNPQHILVDVEEELNLRDQSFIPTDTAKVLTHIADSIRDMREYRSMSIAKLSMLSGVDKKTIKKIERSSPKHKYHTQQGKWMPSITVLCLLGDALKMNLNVRFY